VLAVGLLPGARVASSAGQPPRAPSAALSDVPAPRPELETGAAADGMAPGKQAAGKGNAPRAEALAPATVPQAVTRNRWLRAELTAYSASAEEGTAGGITFSGTRARPGTVAVDPAVIPLGSRLRIAGLAGTHRAEDTGGGIRGAHVDVFMPSRADALRFGRRTGVVELLD
jgi:3D (Asp-Asp-Asp) domain-containing protein